VETPRRPLAGAVRRHSSAIARAAERTIFAAAASAAIALAAQPAPAQATESPVAIVGGDAISGDDFINYLRGYLRSKLYHGGSPERVRELAGEALDNLVIDRLLAREARRMGIPGDPDEVADRMAKLRDKYSKREDWPEIEAGLPKVEREILIDTQIEALKAKITEVAAPTPDQLRAFHHANPGLFTTPPSADLDLILVGVDPGALAAEWTDAQAKAERVLAALQSGQAFDALAAEYSTHESRTAGGHLGPVHRGQLPAEAEAAVAQLQAGQTTRPIRVLEGYAILRLNGRTGAQLQPYDSVADRVEVLYRRERAKEQWSHFLTELRASTPVETFDVTAHVQRMLAGE